MERSTTRAVMYQYGVTVQEIAQRCGKPRLRVQDALDLERCGSVRHSTVQLIRSAVEAALTEAGFVPPDGRSLSDYLWAEYDQNFEWSAAA